MVKRYEHIPDIIKITAKNTIFDNNKKISNPSITIKRLNDLVTYLLHISETENNREATRAELMIMEVLFFFTKKFIIDKT